MHVPEECNENVGELLQRGILNDRFCPSSSSAFQKRNQRASLDCACGAEGGLITGTQTPERNMVVLEGI